MKHFFDWFPASGKAASPWLMFGKGPSFDKRHDFDLSAYATLSLNHVVREGPVDVAHMIDIDVVPACEQALEQHAGVLVMPWIPHVGNRVGEKTLEQWVREIPVPRIYLDPNRHFGGLLDDAEERLAYYRRVIAAAEQECLPGAMAVCRCESPTPSGMRTCRCGRLIPMALGGVG